MLRADGRWLRVERVEARAGRRTVYNLEVDGWHTYVVGRPGAWVHNNCDPKGVGEFVRRVVHPSSLRPTEKLGSKSFADKLSKIMKDPKRGYDPSKPIEAVEAEGHLYIQDGHHRRAAAMKAKLSEVPVLVRQAVDAEEAKALFRAFVKTLSDAGF